MKRVLTLLGCTLLLVFAATAAADSPETGVVLRSIRCTESSDSSG